MRTSSFFVLNPNPELSPITHSQEAEQCDDGWRPENLHADQTVKIHTPKPTTKAMNKTFIAFLLISMPDGSQVSVQRDAQW